MTADSLFGALKKVVTRVASFVSAHKVIAIAAVAVLLGGVFFLRSGDTNQVFIPALQKQFIQEVSVSGKVKAAQEVLMSFEQSGRVERVGVAVGDTVEEGDSLVALASGSLRAELLAAEAAVISKRNERANSVVNLDEVMKQEDTKVASAYAALLSSGLVATAQSDTYEATAPVVTGRYAGTKEGVYKFRIRSTGSGSDLELLTFDLESIEAVKVSETSPTPLGAQGLFVSFPSSLSAYRDTTWYVEIPNTKSASYADLRATYDEAVRSRSLAIEQARASLAQYAENIGIADAALVSAEAEVARLSAELARYTLRAPFAGTVTFVDVEPGDTARIDTPAVAVMSVDRLEIESFVPEINVSSLQVGDPARITLDAYGETEVFNAHVVAIDPAETVRDGVSTYRARLAFDVPDERIRPGMTANIVITTDMRENVLLVPLGAVMRSEGGAYVYVRDGSGVEKRAVTTGNTSSLGEIEIRSGLTAGEEVRTTR